METQSIRLDQPVHPSSGFQEKWVCMESKSVVRGIELLNSNRKSGKKQAGKTPGDFPV
jgi:hypothetical protein